MLTKKQNNISMIILIVLSIAFSIMSFIPTLSFRAFYLVAATFTSLFAYHEAKNPISIIVMIIVIVLFLYLLVTGSYGLLINWY